MPDTDNLHSAINSLQENADRIAAIGKLSEDLLTSQIQLSAGIRQMTDGLSQMHSNQLEISKEVESINKTDLSIRSDIAALQKNLLNFEGSVDTSIKGIAVQIAAANTNMVSKVKLNRRIIVWCSIVVVAVVVILHFV